MSKRSVETALGFLMAGTWLAMPATARAEGYDPYATVSRGPVEIDMAELVRSPRVAKPQAQPDLSALAEQPEAPKAAVTSPRGTLPDGWVQLGEVVQREEVAMGFAAVPAEPSAAWEDIEGNQYPRKHTLFLNFNGGKLYNGADNSAEDRSTLAGSGTYPQFNGAESTALSLIQAVQADMESIGVVVKYETRPSKTVPYTMVMIGGDWEDTNIDSPAGGVAPGTDCEARGQRHVVYVFDKSSATVGQEAAHAWGLDHTVGADRIMSYTPGLNKHFGSNCQALCEEGCQGPGSIGCRFVHEKYCGVDSEQQNDLAELAFIFGTNEPDDQPPEVMITAPEGDQVLEPGASVGIAGFIHDNYGGVGWRLVVTKDGETIFDEVDYEKDLAWNFSKIPTGLYEVILEAEDHFGHIVQDKITLFVGLDGPVGTDSDAESSGGGGEGTGGGGEGTGGGSGGSEASGDVPTSDGVDPETSGGGSGSTTAPAGDESSDGGCRISPHAGGPAGLLAPLLGLGLAWRARRRR
jgi:hypothetical protein